MINKEILHEIKKELYKKHKKFLSSEEYLKLETQLDKLSRDVKKAQGELEALDYSVLCVKSLLKDYIGRELDFPISDDPYKIID